MSLNYFDLTLEDSIEYTSAQDQLDVDFQTMGGNPNVVRGILGVESIAAGYQNAVTDVNRRVLDIAMTANFDTGFGTFDAGFNASYYLNYDLEESYGTGDLYNGVGTLGFPEWKSNFNTNWAMGAWFANLNIDYIGENQSRIDSSVKWDGWTTANLAVGYKFEDYGTFTVGATNITNEDPILNTLGEPVDEYQYSQVGRVVYLRYAIDF